MLSSLTPKHPSLQRPGRHLRWKLGVLKWAYFSFFCRLKSYVPGFPRLQFGKQISLQGNLRIKGPGTVIIGDNVIIGANVDLYTHAPDAIIRIGENTFLNGTRMGASKLIEIGPNNIIADVRMMDCDFHWTHKNRMTDHSPLPLLPIVTEANVWVAAGSAIMKGVRIGENSVVAFGSVVTASIPKDEVWGGVPAKKISDLPLPPAHHGS